MLKALVKRLPPIARLLAQRDALLRAQGSVPCGHFYSPVVSVDEAAADAARLWPAPPRALPGIDMDEAGQLERLAAIEALYPSIDLPAHPAPGHRYHYENPAYGYSDAIFLHAMLRLHRPRRVIEVGSGHSSCVMLDTNERHLGGATRLTFIDPHADLLRSLLRPGDVEAVEILEMRVQDVALARFEALEANDILFIDSSHVAKTGSDVNHLLFEVLPALQPGVLVHVHDIHWPFEYPREWVMEGRSYNEAYALRAFLQYNPRFAIELMNTFLQLFHRERFAERMPLCLRNGGGSLWLRKRPA